MRILFVITSSHIGGTEKFLYQLVSHLDKSRFQAVVCSLKKAGYFAHCLEGEGIPVYSLNMPEKVDFLTPFFCLAGFFYLLYLIKKEKIEIIHSFLFRANILTRLAGALARVKMIISSERCLSRNKRPAAVWLDRHTAWACKYILANSQAVANLLGQRERINPQKIRVIYNGIEPKTLPSLTKGDKYIIGCVARLHPDKGLTDLLHAAALIVKDFPNFVIILVGDGPERKNLETLAKCLGIRQQVIFTGFRQDVDSMIKTFDLFVLPSLEESFPMVLLEVMSLGVAVIATAVGGVPEIVIHNQTGILIPPASPDALAEAIFSLIYQPDLGKTLGQAARCRVENNFSLLKSLNLTQKLYEVT